MQEIYDSLSRTSKKLMFKEPFYGLYLMSLNKDISERVGTACVSKQNINVQLTINPKFWEEMDEITRIGILKHELLHICFGHLDCYDRFADKELANIATDLEINQYVGADNKGPKWDGLELSSYPELKLPERAGSKVYYDILDKINKKRKPQPGQGQPDPNQQGDQGQPQQGQNPGKGQDQPQNQKGKGGSGNNGKTPETSKIWDLYDAMKNGKEGHSSHKLWDEFTEGMNDAEKKLIKKQIEHQIKQIAEDVQKSRGTIPSELKSMIDNLFEVKEQAIDWKSYLRRFGSNSNKIFTKKSRRKLNKRYAGNPAIKIKVKKSILIARDTSGSVSHADHVEFFNELHHIHKTGVKITIVDCDAATATPFVYDGKTPNHITGGGGTDFDPSIKFYNENYKIFDSFIYLTDGECPAPKTKPRGNAMLWVITSGGTLNYSKDYPGKVIQIKR